MIRLAKLISACRTGTVRALVLGAVSLLVASFAAFGPLTSAAEAAPLNRAVSATNIPASCKTTYSKSGKTTKCLYLTISKRMSDLVFGDSVKNRSKGTVSMSCTSTTAATKKWELSGSVTGEGGAIFGKISVSVSGGISHEVTSSRGSTVSFAVPGKTTMNCDRVIYWYSFSGTIITTHCTGSANAYCSSSSSKFKGRAPQRNRWVIYKAHV